MPGLPVQPAIRMAMNVALIGPTCAGKTTCATLLGDGFPLRHLSTGQVLRENQAQRTALGILTRKYVERGELVPDEVINAMIEEAVRKLPPEEGILLDGFPSTLYQARFLEELFKETGRQLDAVVFMPIPEPVVFARAARRIPNRPDDRPEILHRRLQQFQRTVGPVIGHYRQAGRLVFLEASGSIDAVCAALTPVFEDLRRRLPPPALTAGQQRFLDEFLLEKTPDKIATPQPSLDLVVMGPPGSGKGTHSAFLATHFKLPHIATGNLFRENMDDGTVLGKIARTYIDRGELVPDDVSEAMVRERLARADTHEGYVLDGFPRTLPQAKALDEIMADLNRKLDRILYLAVPDEDVVARISGRWLCPICQTPYHLVHNPPRNPGRCDKDGSALYQRDDDTAETIRARLKVFHGQTVPVIEYYRQAGLVVEVPGAGAVAEVDQALLQVVQQTPRR